MIHLLLAAAISTGTAKPLFVPPKGMKPVPPDRRTAAMALRAQATIIAQYRGFVSIKPSWSSFSYRVPETITVVRHATAINADEAGVRALSEIASAAARMAQSAVAYCSQRANCNADTPKIVKLAAKPVALCNGQRGWLNEYSEGARGDIYEQVYARAGTMMYVAATHYSRDSGDVLHAAKALTTLCPAGIGDVRDSATVLIAGPPHWIRGAGTLSEAVPSPYKVLAYWFYLPPQSLFGQALALVSAPDASEYITPDQEAASILDGSKAAYKAVHVQANKAVKLCSGIDGWFTQFTAMDQRADKYVTEMMFVYGSDTSYILRYMRATGEPEDAAAHKALYSLCPPQSASQ